MSTQETQLKQVQDMIVRVLESADTQPLQAYLARMGKAWDRDEQLNFVEELTFSLCDDVAERLGTEFTIAGATPALLELWERLKQVVGDLVLSASPSKAKAHEAASVILRMLVCQYRPELAQ